MKNLVLFSSNSSTTQSQGGKPPKVSGSGQTGSDKGGKDSGTGGNKPRQGSGSGR